MRKKSILLMGGFLLFGVSMLSIILSLVGVRLNMLVPIDNLGFMWAFLIKMLLLLTGLIMAYVASSDQERE